MKRRKVASHALSGERQGEINSPKIDDKKQKYSLPTAIVALALLALFSWVYMYRSNNAWLLQPKSIDPTAAIFQTEQQEIRPVSLNEQSIHRLVEEVDVKVVETDEVIDEEADEVIEEAVDEADAEEVIDEVEKDVVSEDDEITKTTETVTVKEAVVAVEDSTIPAIQWMMDVLSTQLDYFKNILQLFAKNVQTSAGYELFVPVLVHRYQQTHQVLASMITHLSHNNILVKGAQTIRTLYIKYFSEYVQGTLLPQIYSGIVDMQSLWTHMISYSLSNVTKIGISTSIHSSVIQMKSMLDLTQVSCLKGYHIVISYFTQHVVPAICLWMNHVHHFLWNISIKVVELGESHFHVHDMDTYTVIMIGLGAVVGVVFLKGKPYPLTV